ncbi:MAG TPA: zf-HC2 domain-containing protein [Candidatus Binatia bacterium]|nr:zf-HC2 domain-containing protein [Candidatus Binatia bacterium]
MNHPTSEQLVSWVYGEATPKEQRELRAHLNECADCRAQIETWRGTMKTLDELPAPVAHRRSVPAPLQWAAAAAVLLAVGIGLGRFAFAGGLRASMKTEVQQQVAAIRADLAQEFENRQREVMSQVVAAAEAKIAANTQNIAVELANNLEQARAEDRATYLLALKELNAKHESEVAALKKGLETVVALADYGFEATEQRLAQLAANQNSPQQ